MYQLPVDVWNQKRGAPVKAVARPYIRLPFPLLCNTPRRRVLNFFAYVFGQERAETYLALGRRRLDEALGHELLHRDLEVA